MVEVTHMLLQCVQSCNTVLCYLSLPSVPNETSSPVSQCPYAIASVSYTVDRICIDCRNVFLDKCGQAMQYSIKLFLVRFTRSQHTVLASFPG